MSEAADAGLSELGEGIAERFRLGASLDLTGPVARGRVVQVWRLRTEHGLWAVKETTGPLDVAAAEAQAAYQELVREAGVLTPAVARTVDGRVSDTVLGHTVRVATWVDLRELDRRLDPGAVGRVMATLHRVRLPAPGPVDPWFAEPVPLTDWERLIEQLDTAGAPFRHRLERLLPDLAALPGLVEPHEPVQWCHRDLFADNVLATSDGQLCVIDWDNAGPADPSRELALALLEYGCGDPARTAGVYAAYRTADGPGRVRSLADFSMAVCVLTHITAEGCRRWLAARTEDDRRDNAAWVAEFLDEPLTVAGLREVLSWLGEDG